MKFRKTLRWLTPAMLACAAIGASAAVARAQSAADLNAKLNAIAPQVEAAANNQATADEVVGKLDDYEAEFARLAEAHKGEAESLLPIYTRLDGMLNRMYTVYKQKKDDCINTVSNGGECDYDVPEQISLKALYPLSWLRFTGASLYANNATEAQKLLNAAIDGFTESTLVIVAPELIRENLLGRAYCERELGRYDHSEYDKAIADFKQVMGDGTSTKQYNPARQGLATTYAAMGKMDEAAKITGSLASSGGASGGMAMLHLVQLLKAEQATSDPAKKAEFHKEAVDFMSARQNDKEGWAIVIAAVAQNVKDPVAVYGNTSDPFQNWLLANVLFSKGQKVESAKYYVAAAHSGKYPKGYHYGADIYLGQKRYDLAEQLVNEMAHQGGGDAPWASYMRFKLPHTLWEQGGMKNAQQESQWAAAAQDYLKSYPRGEFAYEAHFDLADKLEREKQYLAAAKEFSEVSGNADFEFNAKFQQARSDFSALEATQSKDSKQPAPSFDRDAVRREAVESLQETIKMAPAAERSSGGQQRTYVRELKGAGVRMLASLLVREPKPDYAEIASLLDNFESQYPSEKDHFNDVSEWRITALERLGKYDEAERLVRGVVEKRCSDPNSTDFLKELGLDFWRSASLKLAKNDQAGHLADARLTAATYECFENLANEGKIPAKNLTGTLSYLGDAYMVIGDSDKAENIYNQVVKADPASPAANAGLAKIAQSKKDYKNAIDLWTRVESTAAESDDLWYESKYNLAQVYSAQGNLGEACRKLAQTRSEHPTLGSPEMKAKWDALQRRLCLGQTQTSM